MAKQIVQASGAPAALGAYSQGVVANGFVYISGQLGLDPASGELISDDVREQARQAMKNIAAILAGADSSMDDAVKVTIYLTDIADFPLVNEVYAALVGETPPARVTIQVAGLPLGAKVEIDMVAVAGGEEVVK